MIFVDDFGFSVYMSDNNNDDDNNKKATYNSEASI